jgi:ankyrin repeat protein
MTLFSIFIVLHCSAFAGTLQDAAKSGDLSLTKRLIDEGAEIDASDQYGATPLYWAAFKGHANIAELLIAKGAKVNTKNMIGDTPLHGAMASCSFAVSKLLLEKGAGVNETRKEGSSPLHIAVERCDKTMVELLISKGAKIDAQIPHGQMSGQTPLYRAASKNLLDMAALLLSEGANPSISNKDGDTPLHVAAAYGYKSMVELLLSKGANPSAKSKDGTTPAQFARQQGHPDIAQLLDSKPMFTTYKNNAHKFSIKYPNHWNVLTEAQIKSMAAGMSGTAPSFAAQSPTRESMFVIAAPTTPVAEKAFAANTETGLRKQYSEFTGTPPPNWVRTSDSTRDVNGVKALLVEWKMPPIQGVVLMQKHMCLIVGMRAFLVSATSDMGSWKENDSKWFTPTFESFQVTK